MKIIKTEEINGMTVNTYDNGIVEKYMTGSKVEDPEPIEAEAQPTNADILAEVKKSHSDIIDDYTLELMEQGVI